MSVPEHEARGSLDVALDYAALIRLPNLFTAAADVMMGFLFVRWSLTPAETWALALLVLASCALYAAGTVLNDVFDYQLDLEQRPERPLPSGRIGWNTARWLGAGFLGVGLAAAWGAAWLLGLWLPGVVATLLAAAVVLYDAWLKRTPLGPLSMGTCRLLNVLLGMSVATTAWAAENWLVAGGIAVYVVGLTWFARSEASRSSRLALLLALAVMLAGIGLLGWLPRWSEALCPLLMQDPGRWYLITGALGALIGWRCVWAVFDPRPSVVQAAVRQAILSLIMLDAVACFAKRDIAGAIAIAILLVPAVLTAQWIDAT